MRLHRVFLLAFCILWLCRSASALDLHIAPNGNDAQPGTKEEPFATLERARDEVRKLKKEQGLPKGGVTVSVHGGAYVRGNSFALSAEDSGTADAPIIYQAVKGEPVRFIGGRVVTGWKPVTLYQDAAYWGNWSAAFGVGTLPATIMDAGAL